MQRRGWRNVRPDSETGAEKKHGIVCVSKNFLRDDMTRENGYRPLSAADCTAAVVLLLLLHLLEDGVLLDLDEVATFILSQTKPELLDPLAFLGRACTPDLVVARGVLVRARGCGCARFVGSGCVRRWG